MLISSFFCKNTGRNRTGLRPKESIANEQFIPNFSPKIKSKSVSCFSLAKSDIFMNKGLIKNRSVQDKNKQNMGETQSLLQDIFPSTAQSLFTQRALQRFIIYRLVYPIFLIHEYSLIRKSDTIVFALLFSVFYYVAIFLYICLFWDCFPYLNF